jgi:hypothetical protein
VARADDGDADSAEPWPARTDDIVLGPAPTRAFVETTNRRWRGVGLGFDMGLWGRTFAQGLKIDIPFGRRIGQFVGARARGLWGHHDLTGRYDPVINTGLELFGRGPVLWGVMRVYGGGGVWVGTRPFPTNEGTRWRVSGGGHFGFEAMIAPRASFTFEVGGQSSGHALGVDAGASVMGGTMVYLGALKRRR